MPSTSEPMHTKGSAVAEGVDSNDSSAVADAVDLNVSSAVAGSKSGPLTRANYFRANYRKKRLLHGGPPVATHAGSRPMYSRNEPASKRHRKDEEPTLRSGTLLLSALHMSVLGQDQFISKIIYFLGTHPDPWCHCRACHHFADRHFGGCIVCIQIRDLTWANRQWRDRTSEFDGRVITVHQDTGCVYVSSDSESDR